MDLLTVKPSAESSFRLEVRGHQIVSDMPCDEGGTDRGLRPVELLVGSLGTCIAQAVARYCQAIHCPTEGLEVSLTYQISDRPKRITSIVVDLELPPHFPENRKESIKRVIDSCPVHNSLQNVPEIDLEIT